MIKNIILILLTVLSIIFGTLYMQEKEYSKRLEEKIQSSFIAQINFVKHDIKEIGINLESTINSNKEDEEYLNFLQEVLEEEKLVKLLEKSQSNQENIDIQIFKYRKILQSYEDLKTSFENLKEIIENKNKEKDKIAKVIQENNEIESNDERNNQVEVKELDEEEPVKVVFDNSNIKSLEENTTLEELYNKLENDLNITKENVSSNIYRLSQKLKESMHQNEYKKRIESLTINKKVCINLENIYKSRQEEKILDSRIIKLQNSKVLSCYEQLKMIELNNFDKLKIIIDDMSFLKDENLVMLIEERIDKIINKVKIINIEINRKIETLQKDSQE